MTPQQQTAFYKAKLAELMLIHDVVKYDESQHPRDARGRWTPFEAGRQARLAGKTEADNPYLTGERTKLGTPKMTEEGHDWLAGHRDAIPRQATRKEDEAARQVDVRQYGSRTRRGFRRRYKKSWPYQPQESTLDFDYASEQRGRVPSPSRYFRHGVDGGRDPQQVPKPKKRKGSYGDTMTPGSQMQVIGRNRIAKMQARWAEIQLVSDMLGVTKANPYHDARGRFASAGGILGKASAFVEQAHAGQKRMYTNEPYTGHLYQVGAALQDQGFPDDVVAAGLLHDTVEDTTTTHEDIEREFGPRVAKLVRETTKISKKPGERATRKAIDLAHFASGSMEGQSIKLADIADNISTVAERDPKFARVYMKEKKALVAALDKGHPALRSRAQKIIDDYYGIKKLDQQWLKSAQKRLHEAQENFRKWDEAAHPRGKTSDASNPGSFAPAEGGNQQSFQFMHNMPETEPEPKKPEPTPIDRRMHDFGFVNANGTKRLGYESHSYNCMAFACGDQDHWWWPSAGEDFEESTQQIHEFFGKYDGSTTSNEAIEPGFTKIATYSDDAGIQHFARQMNNGRWASKLGANMLVEHELGDLLGSHYGDSYEVWKFPTMKWAKMKTSDEMHYYG